MGNFLKFSLGTLFYQVVLVLSGLFLAKSLPLAELGEWGKLKQMLVVFGFVTLGINQSLLYRLPLLDKRSPKIDEELFRLNGFVAVIMFMIFPFLWIYQDDYILTFLLLFFYTFSPVNVTLKLTVKRKMIELSYRRLLIAIFMIIILLSEVYYFEFDALRALTEIYGAHFILAWTSGPIKFRVPAFSWIIDNAGQGLIIRLNSLIWELMILLDFYFIEQMAGQSAIGRFTFLISLTTAFKMLPGLFFDYLIPHLGRTDNTTGKFEGYIEKYGLRVAILYFIVGVSALIVFIRIFFTEFYSDILALCMMALISIVLLLLRPLISRYFYAKNEVIVFKYSLVYSMSVVVVNSIIFLLNLHWHFLILGTLCSTFIFNILIRKGVRE